jgi:hypothetical protein
LASITQKSCTLTSEQRIRSIIRPHHSHIRIPLIPFAAPHLTTTTSPSRDPFVVWDRFGSPALFSCLFFHNKQQNLQQTHCRSLEANKKNCEYLAEKNLSAPLHSECSPTLTLFFTRVPASGDDEAKNKTIGAFGGASVAGASDPQL